MTFSIHLEDEIFRQVERAATESGKARNALIRQALREWLADRRPAVWPREVMAFKGFKAAPRFESRRSELKQPREPF